jgi:hypothetical protein
MQSMGLQLGSGRREKTAGFDSIDLLFEGFSQKPLDAKMSSIRVSAESSGTLEYLGILPVPGYSPCGT